jgi:uncharacterized protein (DUF2164 family)
MPEDRQQAIIGDDLRAALGDMEQRIIEAMRDMQTEILRGFHSHARGQGARMQRLEVSEAALQARMAAIEERVLALEAKRP